MLIVCSTLHIISDNYFTMYGRTNHHNNGGGETAPMLIPRDRRHDDIDIETSLSQSHNESTPHFLTSPASLTTGSSWATEAFLSCSPMVSGLRSTIHLPNLDLREARRAAMIAANKKLESRWSAEFEKRSSRGKGGEGEEEDVINLRRGRSNSLGNQSERNQLRSSPLTLGADLLHRRTKSGLSLMELTSDAIEQQQQQQPPPSTDEEVIYEDIIDSEDVGYGSTIATSIPKMYTEPLKTTTITEEEDYMPTLKESQSCNIADLGIVEFTSSPHHQQHQYDRAITTADKTLVQELKEEFASQSTHPLISIMYGLVNTSIVLPVVMSFGSIIYHDDFFRPYLSVLMKLTVVSGAVHQMTFSTISSLPFAVGQVQDAGLIFLSAMARDIVSQCKALGVDDASILATTTIGLSMFTAILGGALILVGKFKLASYCQLLPSSVVGGYLAYIGFFCGQVRLQ
jgi:hypothetical protein